MQAPTPAMQHVLRDSQPRWGISRAVCRSCQKFEGGKWVGTVTVDLRRSKQALKIAPFFTESIVSHHGNPYVFKAVKCGVQVLVKVCHPA